MYVQKMKTTYAKIQLEIGLGIDGSSDEPIYTRFAYFECEPLACDSFA